ncbi:UNVERIFIED_CONTAM: hypothetical protein GTU68_012621 [Idotea baltica]|nr:hypothetical protein [Idotea baltica]
MSRPPQIVLVSACLLGCECRYDGRHNRDERLEDELLARGEVAESFCPEERGGLPTPRPAAWIESQSAAEVLEGKDRLVTNAGADVTPEFRKGAEAALARCRELGIETAYLKERSPSCGVKSTHVNGELVEGHGVTAELLHHAGIRIVGIEGRRARD